MNQDAAAKLGVSDLNARTHLTHLNNEAGTVALHQSRCGHSTEGVHLASAQPCGAEVCVGQRQITNVLAVAESAHFLLIIGARVLVPENIECVKEWFNSTKRQVSELRFAI